MLNKRWLGRPRVEGQGRQRETSQTCNMFHTISNLSYSPQERVQWGGWQLRDLNACLCSEHTPPQEEKASKTFPSGCLSGQQLLVPASTGRQRANRPKDSPQTPRQH